MNGIKWSKAEKATARRAFDMAYARECELIAAKLRGMTEKFKEPEDIWRICDYLNEQRKSVDNKYDYRYSVLIFVLARLLSEAWITDKDLNGLEEDKIEKIKYIANM